jgi:hypothetical protein
MGGSSSKSSKQRAVSCRERPKGLLFTLDDGSTRFISNTTPASSWPKVDDQVRFAEPQPSIRPPELPWMKLQV